MQVPYFERTVEQRILFVWDGTNDHIWHAERCLKTGGGGNVIVVHAMPHESIYSYGAVRVDRHESEHLKAVLRDRFMNMARDAGCLRDAKFELLFGDRVTETIRFAEAMKVQQILLPRFTQSSFSKWIHGDLNDRLVEKARCPIVFLKTKPAIPHRKGNRSAPLKF